MCIGSAHYAGRRLNRDGEEIYPFRILFKHVCLEQRYISVPWECKNPRWWIHPLAPRTYRLEEQFWRTYVAPVPRCSPYHRKLPTIAISAQQLREKPVSEIDRDLFAKLRIWLCANGHTVKSAYFTDASTLPGLFLSSPRIFRLSSFCYSVSTLRMYSLYRTLEIRRVRKVNAFGRIPRVAIRTFFFIRVEHVTQEAAFPRNHVTLASEMFHNSGEL